MADEPTLLEQTLALGKLLKAISERDPQGTPSPSAATAFTSWVSVAGATSRESRYFSDVADNFDIFQNTNKDLFRMFELLHPYIEVPEDEAEEPPGAFIGLPVVR